MSEARQRVLDALDAHGCRPSANGTAARCPAHDDHQPSLSIHEATKVKGVVLRCHTGCEVADICAALGLAMTDLYDEPPLKRDQRVLVARYPYTDSGGEVLFSKVRWTPKDFTVEPPGVVGRLATKPLYRAPEVEQAASAGGTVFVVEGEKDADALAARGLVATCNYEGAAKPGHTPKWRAEYTTALKGAQVIVIADRDEAGYAHARHVYGQLKLSAASVVVWEPAAGSDISDHLAAGLEMYELVAVDLDEDLPTPDAEPAAESDDAVRELLPLVDWHELWTRDTKEEWIIEPLLPARRLVALYSPPKVGKSLLMLELAVAIVRGTPALGVTPDRARRVLYVDFENDMEGDIRDRLIDMRVGPDDLGNLCYLSFPTLSALDSQQGGVELLAAVETYACEVVVIDTVSRSVKGDENENDTWLAFYRNTGVHLKRAGVALVRLDHTGKDETRGQRGGSAKSGDVDAVWRMSKVTETTFQLDCEASRMQVPEKTLVLHRRDFPLRHDVDALGWMAAKEEKVVDIIARLDALGAPRETGGEKARELLRTAGFKAKNTLIAEAVKRRKSPVPEFRGQVGPWDLSPPAGDR